MRGGNIGTYSITTSLSLPWNNKPKAVELEKRKKTLKPIINPIFEKCAGLTDDKFWQSTFMNCARGKFPRGFSYKNHLITHRKGNKMSRLEISNSPSEVYTATKDFFAKTVGLMSKEDRKRMQRIEEEKLLKKLQEESEMVWKDIKSEKMKDILISEFILNLSEKIGFGEEEKKGLTTTIKKGFMLKYFTSSNVKMDEGCITEIEGLIYDKKTQEYYIDPKCITKQTGRKVNGLGLDKTESVSRPNFIDTWVKYLEGLENKRVKKSHTYSSSFSMTNNDSEDLTKSDYYTS